MTSVLTWHLNSLSYHRVSLFYAHFMVIVLMTPPLWYFNLTKCGTRLAGIIILLLKLISERVNSMLMVSSFAHIACRTLFGFLDFLLITTFKNLNAIIIFIFCLLESWSSNSIFTVLFSVSFTLSNLLRPSGFITFHGVKLLRKMFYPIMWRLWIYIYIFYLLMTFINM